MVGVKGWSRPPASCSMGAIRTVGHRPIRSLESGPVRRSHKSCRPLLHVHRGEGARVRPSAPRTAATRRVEPMAAAGDLFWVWRPSWFRSCRHRGYGHGTQMEAITLLYCNIRFRCGKPRKAVPVKSPVQRLMTTADREIPCFSQCRV